MLFRETSLGRLVLVEEGTPAHEVVEKKVAVGVHANTYMHNVHIILLRVKCRQARVVSEMASG